MEKPENLIPKKKMVLILNDLAIVNAAKVTNAEILLNNKIEPTEYIFEKYGIDSTQFVESDRYYASVPEEHEEIYIAVEAKLKAEKDRIVAEKKFKDSIKAAGKGLDTKDDLLKNVDKQK